MIQPRLRRALLALALAPLLAGAAPDGAPAAPGFSPLTAEQPDVRAGNERLAAGDAAGALSAYDAAERAVGPRAEIDFDRGHALLAQGKHAEARQAWRKAAEADARGQGRLSSRAWQNMGSALAAAGDQEAAKRAFSEALRRDPANEDARYNLEVLQRRPKGGQGAPQPQGDPGQKPERGPSQQGAGAQPPDGQAKRDGKDEKEEKGGKSGQQAQQGQPPPSPQGQAQPPSQQPSQQGSGKDEERREREAGAKQEEQPGGQAPQAGPRPPDGEGKPGAGQADDLDRREAERILDTLRSRERPMPLGPAARTDDRRRDVEKDW